MWILLVVLALVVMGVILIYNGLVKLREQVDASWSDIDVQLKRRHDLIPNLVSTVQGYASHERETLEAVIQARNQAMGAQGPEARAEAENQLTGTLRSLFALSESYPQLRANENFMDLQRNLQQLEDAIQRARRYYNAVVRDYNTKIRSVPSNLVANAFSFRPREFFEIEEGERSVPRVDFGSGGGG
ncbi:MAG: LemA family protein [Gemmatimonadales bacterium]|nr:MAG: LemA family protein [Gemmatimonadales bacterium]